MQKWNHNPYPGQNYPTKDVTSREKSPNFDIKKIVKYKLLLVEITKLQPTTTKSKRTSKYPRTWER